MIGESREAKREQRSAAGRSIAWLVHGVGAFGALGVQLMLWAASYGFQPRRLVGDEYRYLREALDVWQGQVPVPNYIWPPLQKWFLAPLLGPLDGKLWLAQWVQMLLMVVAALLLRKIWQQLDPRPLAADMAFWLMLCSPAIMAFGYYLWPEPLHMVLLMAALYFLVCHPRSLWASLLAGIAVSLALLTKSLLSAFWPMLLLLLVRWPLSRSCWRQAIAFVVALLVVAGPFMYQGWQATGKPLIADSSVYNLYVGINNDWRSDYVYPINGKLMREYQRAGDTPVERNAVFQQRVDSEVAARGGWEDVLVDRLGIQYFRLFNAKRTVLSQLPGESCAGYLGAYTVPEHWRWGIQWLTRGQYLALLVLAAFGMVLWRKPSLLLTVIGLFFAYQLVLFLGLHVKARYLLPLLPLLGGFAASSLCSLLPASVQSGRGPLRASGMGLASASVLASLLLFLAMAGPWLDASCAGVG